MRITDGRGADLILDGVGQTTFKGDLDAAPCEGTSWSSAHPAAPQSQ
jgi:hypothetical protein